MNFGQLGDMTDLPIGEVLPSIAEHLEARGRCVVKAPTGAGKTTQVPQGLLEADLADQSGRTILVVQPRRLAAIGTARRVASERGCVPGQQVGYQVRFNSKRSAATRVLFITEGLLLRKLQEDPLLTGVEAVVLDEFHERSIQADLSLAFLRELIEVRDDFSLVVMSATIQTGPIAEYLNAPVVESEGRLHPIDIEYVGRHSERGSIEEDVVRGVRKAIESESEDDGDILIFLPGAGSIHRSLDGIRSRLNVGDYELFPLYGSLAPDRQAEVLERPDDTKRIIASTNIAETSLTLEGVTTVVDSGLVKQLEFSPEKGLNKLETVRISKSSAEQRAGRAGRVRPGRAFRLWRQSEERHMPDKDVPAIQRVDVTGAILEVIQWSGADPREFNWFEAPERPAIDRAIRLLRDLEILGADGFKLTELGKTVAGLPVHPRIGRVLVAGATSGMPGRAAGIAALLSERDFVLDAPHDNFRAHSDFEERLDILIAGRPQSGRDIRTSRGRLEKVKKVQNQLTGLVDEIEPTEASQKEPADRQLRRALAHGYPDRLCLPRGQRRQYVSISGEPLLLSKKSVVSPDSALIAPVIRGKVDTYSNTSVSQRRLIQMASEIDAEWFKGAFPQYYLESVDVEFDADKKRVVARRRAKLGSVVVDSEPVSVDSEASEQLVVERLIEAASKDLEEAFDLSEEDKQFIERLAFLNARLDELDIEVWDADAGQLDRETLKQICWGARSFKELSRMNLRKKLRRFLNHETYEALEKLAPASLRVPAGVERQLTYDGADPPELEVRIQEMFGATQTPTVLDGRVPVRLVLLAPNFRPAQVTQDLPNFWDSGYPEVRKQMRGRYPKHPWPENPREATAVSV